MLLLHGVAAFNTGHFLEAHEIWEAAWNDAVGEEKRFVQGLVQLATGYLKLASAQNSGARKLLTRGCQTLRAFPSTYAGLQIGVLCDASDVVTQQLVKGQLSVDIRPPQILPGP